MLSSSPSGEYSITALPSLSPSLASSPASAEMSSQLKPSRRIPSKKLPTEAPFACPIGVQSSTTVPGPLSATMVCARAPTATPGKA